MIVPEKMLLKVSEKAFDINSWNLREPYSVYMWKVWHSAVTSRLAWAGPYHSPVKYQSLPLHLWCGTPYVLVLTLDIHKNQSTNLRTEKKMEKAVTLKSILYILKLWSL